MLQGQLKYDEFQQAIHLFVDWWHQACPVRQQLSWTVQKVLLPVTEHVVEYALLERIIAPAAEAPAVAKEDSTSACLHDALDCTAATAGQVCTAAARPAQLGSSSYCRTTSAVSDAANAIQPIAVLADHENDGDHEDSGTVILHCCSCTAQQQQCVHVHQYSVVWHDIYQVPVLYIKAFKPDGMQLSLQELLLDLPALQQYKDPDQADWTFLTPIEHPLLRSRCFMLHPCQTAARMQLMMQSVVNAAAAAGTQDVGPLPSSTAAACGALPPPEEVSGSQNDHAIRSLAPAALLGVPSAMQSTALATEDQQQVGNLPSSSSRHSVSTELLLLYMKGWFSMVAGLLQIDLLRFLNAGASKGPSA